MDRKDRINKLLGLIPWRASLLDVSPIDLYKRAISAYGNESTLAKALNENRISWKNGLFLHDGKTILSDVSTIPDNMRVFVNTSDAIAYYLEGLILERQEQFDGEY
jgi:hypothetical protein